MLIKILTSVAGLDFSYQSGQTVEVGQKLAEDLIAAGYASPVKTQTETAVIEPTENTARTPTTKKRR